MYNSSIFMVKQKVTQIALFYLVHAQIAVGSHHSHGDHGHQQPVTSGYDVGTHQVQQQQAVDGYQVGNAVDHHHGADHGQARHQGNI